MVRSPPPGARVVMHGARLGGRAEAGGGEGGAEGSRGGPCHMGHMGGG